VLSALEWVYSVLSSDCTEYLTLGVVGRMLWVLRVWDDTESHINMLIVLCILKMNMNTILQYTNMHRLLHIYFKNMHTLLCTITIYY
jgi:hypothetical protein